MHDIQYSLHRSIKVKYLDPKLPPLEFVGGNIRSNWVDLRAAYIKGFEPTPDGKYHYFTGESFLIGLGFALELPKGFEAHVVPRSSTFKNYGLIQTNGMGVIDEAYCGDGDEWFMPVLAIRDGVLTRYDRIAQFRIMEKMPVFEFLAVDQLGHEDRGGHGSSGTK